MAKFKIVASRKPRENCPNCKEPDNVKIFICTKCGKEFCGRCFISIPEAGRDTVRGDIIKCPHCKKVLRF